MTRTPSRTPLARDRARGATALLIVDMISTWDFPDADKLVRGAARIAPRIARLARRCRLAGVPVIYVNDNHGRWQSDFREVLARSLAGGAPGADMSSLLAPAADDYFVLKPKHSAFFATPLDLLLRHLGAGRLILTGVAADHCIALTAAEGRMRDFDVVVPADGVAAQTAARQAAALRHLHDVLAIATPTSARLRLVERQDAGRRPR